MAEPAAKRDVMIMVAPNGARKTRADHPALPMTPGEIAAEAARSVAAGAAAIHLHVRDTGGSHSLDADAYRAATDAVRAAVGRDPVIQITTEAVGRFAPREQMASVRAVRPEAVSLALREIVPDASGEEIARRFLDWAGEAGIAVQTILYTPDEVTRFLDLLDRKIVAGPAPFLLFVLGRHTTDQQSAPEDLDPFVTRLGGRAIPWAMCAFGRHEAACALHAAELGGHVRVGFENNFHLPDGRSAASNGDLVEATVRLLAAHGYRPMGAGDARSLMGI